MFDIPSPPWESKCPNRECNIVNGVMIFINKEIAHIETSNIPLRKTRLYSLRHPHSLNAWTKRVVVVVVAAVCLFSPSSSGLHGAWGDALATQCSPIQPIEEVCPVSLHRLERGGMENVPEK
jgi:hypothetical protein